MKISNHNLLKEIVKKREVSLAELSPLIVRQYDDYRDYFPLACLVVSGYVACDFRNASGKPYDEPLLASMFYAKVTGKEHVNNYHCHSGTDGSYAKLLTMTAKSQLYFDELRAKRSERLFTALISVIVGVTSAIITLTIQGSMKL
ncbi:MULTISPECIES: hypothetical protein [Vibrio]|uniref:hypothetical protein n=1 Tax=Vibrio TaxID=662 RepID=UPI00074450A1|nr:MULTISPECIES: hypothetical protein [Vibrio]EGQ9635535.1 hypothetical protein [Vibrio cholerae]EGR0029482.1 hypothetical protein [Vibrio cholerae]EGR0660028.1 hypothetical protein [Vibrio cholerae]EGR5155420.1 hypothetical protein [Vibrio cholerae]EIC9845557.1 hypothetical protein [Vibrio cholerae]